MNRNRRSILLVCSLILCSVYLTECNTIKFKHGERAYLRYCADCHMEDGKGVAKLYPSLFDSDLVADSKILPCLIVNGYNDSMTIMQMVPVEGISSIDITNITNYLRQDLLSLEGTVTIQQVDRTLENCSQNIVK